MKWSSRPAWELVPGDIVSWHGDVHKVGSVHYHGDISGNGSVTLNFVDGIFVICEPRDPMRIITD